MPHADADLHAMPVVVPLDKLVVMFRSGSYPRPWKKETCLVEPSHPTPMYQGLC